MTHLSSPTRKPQTPKSVLGSLVVLTIVLAAVAAAQTGVDAIFVTLDGDVGIGTDSPATMTSNGERSRLQVTTNDSAYGGVLVTNDSTTGLGRALLELRNNGATRLDQVDTSSGVTWRQTNGATRYRLIDLTDPTVVEFDLKQNGNLTITGSLTTGGPTCGAGCDSVFGAEGVLSSIEEHAAEMWKLGYLPAVGPSRPGEPINLTEKTGNMLSELERAHIYIDQLNDGLEERDARIAALEEAVARLQALVERDPR